MALTLHGGNVRGLDVVLELADLLLKLVKRDKLILCETQHGVSQSAR